MEPLLPHFLQGKLLSELTTFGIGGPAKYFTEASSIQEMQEVILAAHKAALPFIVLGKGSNTLFDDRGFNGLVILNKIAFLKWNNNSLHVGAGYHFSLLGAQTARKGFSGLEFASGIPGSVGGAVYMNAGANGGETFDCLTEVEYVNEKGEYLVYSKEKIDFGYRFSSFQKQRGAIVSARFLLRTSEEARQKQLSLIDYRMKTQPYKDKSAGCVFRNPEGGSAGALIDACGLKAAAIGGAIVSPMHANFIVNGGSATAQDIKQLADLVKNVVKEKKGVDLEMEIRSIPYDLEVS